jgi:hypothetical protein
MKNSFEGTNFDIISGPLSAREKYIKLSKKMHPEAGGSKELMQVLNAAYEEVKKGNPKPLHELYLKWFPEDDSKKPKTGKVDLYV